MKIKYLFIEVLLLILFFSFPISAFCSSNKNNCSLIQKSIFSKIKEYYVKNEIRWDKTVPPGKEFDKLIGEMVDKGFLNNPDYKSHIDCSYGLDIDSLGDLKIYCVYHGDIQNADWFIREIKVKRNYSLSFGFCLMIVLVFISFCVSCIKVSLRSRKSRNSSKKEEANIVCFPQ